MVQVLNRTLGGSGGKGTSASIYVTGLKSITEKKTPDGYTDLEYIESNGGQIIDTGIKSNQDCIHNLRFMLLSANNTYIYGAGYTGNRHAIFYWSSKWGAEVTGGLSGDQYASTGAINQIINFKLTGTELIVDGEIVKLSNGINFTTTENVKLFNRTTAATTSGRMYATDEPTIIENGIPIRHFIPCRNPNNEVGMYDLVSGQFFGNSGTGSFIAGPEVVYTDSVTMTTPSGGIVQGVWDEAPGWEDVEVPIMTSDTTPSGVAFAKSQYDANDAPWRAFSGVSGQTNTPAHSVLNDSNWYIGYDFGFPVCIKRFVLYPQHSGGTIFWSRVTATLILEGSVDGGTWVEIQRFTRTDRLSNISTSTPLTNPLDYEVENENEYRAYRVVYANSTGYSSCNSLQFYGLKQTTIPCFRLLANEYGLHTITATNGTKTSTEDVLVDALMDYWVEIILARTYLYKYGREYEEITGGWYQNANGGNTLAKNIDHLYLYSQSTGKYGYFVTNNTINMTDYSTIHVLAECVRSNNTDLNLRATTSKTAQGTYIAEIINTNISGIKEVSVSVTSLNGKMPVLFQGISGSGGIGEYRVYAVWLE